MHDQPESQIPTPPPPMPPVARPASSGRSGLVVWLLVGGVAVVVLVVAIFLALVLTAMGKAEERANRNLCIAKMRVIVNQYMLLTTGDESVKQRLATDAPNLEAELDVDPSVWISPRAQIDASATSFLVIGGGAELQLYRGQGGGPGGTVFMVENPDVIDGDLCVVFDFDRIECRARAEVTRALEGGAQFVYQTNGRRWRE